MRLQYHTARRSGGRLTQPLPNMSDAIVEWKRLSNLDQPPVGIANEPILSCFLSKVFHFHEGRNVYAGRDVYGGNWATRYPGDASFHLDQAVLKKQIERQRKQGSQFTLTELPALALMGRHHDLLLFQTWGSAPFKQVPRKVISGKTMLEVARSIYEHEHRLNTFILPRGKTWRPILPFKTFRSVPQGTDYSLDWQPVQNKYDLNSIMALVADVTLYLNEG